MKVAQRVDELPRRERAVAIGTFDGVHAGHRRVIETARGAGLPTAVVSARSGARPRIKSAAFSASMMVGALMLPRTMTGITEASTTRKPSTPSTRSWLSTTDPMAQVPTG